MTGHKHSDETKKKISEGKKGKRNPQEAIDRMRLTKIGLKQSEENINKRAIRPFLLFTIYQFSVFFNYRLTSG